MALALTVFTACGDSTTGPGNVASLTLPASLTMTSLDAEVDLGAVAENSAGEPVTEITFTYSSSDASVASVSSDGVVTAEDNGSATITVGVEGSDITATVTVTVDQVPFRLGFQEFSGGPARTALGDVVVEIQDSLGNLVADAAGSVSIAIGENAGDLVFHASGISAGQRIIELVDYVDQFVLTPPLQTTEGADETLGLTYDPELDILYGVDRDNILWTFNPVTGARTLVDTNSAGIIFKGLVLEPEADGRLLASMRDDGVVFELDPMTADADTVGRITVAGDSVIGTLGLAFDPTTGTLYGVVKLNSDNATPTVRRLVTINRTTWAGTILGTLSITGVAGIGFTRDGTLLAVTGDGGANPEQLFSVNKATAAMTHIMNLGNGNDGEAITLVPAQLSGTLTATATSGIATFTGLQINATANGYRFRASASGLADGTSGAFNITP